MFELDEAAGALIPAGEFSHDGSLLATNNADFSPVIYDAATGEEIGAVPTDADATPYALRFFSPDDSMLSITTFLGEDLGIYDVASRRNEQLLEGSIIHDIKAHKAQALRSAWSPDSTMVATGELGGLIRVWDVATV